MGQTRQIVTFTGEANHAGTTPMGSLRRDAMAAAAEWIVEVERYATGTEGLVATVGKLGTSGGAGNVIAGELQATLDVRHSNDPIRRAAVKHLLAFAREAGRRRGVEVSHAITLDQEAVPMNARLTEVLTGAVARATGRPAPRMSSGAGHDAMIVARRIPAALLFLRSPAGLSHHPDESVRSSDVEAALAAGLEFLGAVRDDGTILSGPRNTSGDTTQEQRDA